MSFSVTLERLQVINLLRMNGPMTVADLNHGLGRDLKLTQSLVRRLSKVGGVTIVDGEVSLTPQGYLSIGSFPPKPEAEGNCSEDTLVNAGAVMRGKDAV
ncbi:hypothetical protein GQE99_14555 [Maritimibacter sp. DP07]|uniref:Winged helix-turn-helix DNA-binding n=1 Tax=Maritimibacter harenae TaxID=2606218 RepID=A0A845MB32_9RHOB|nr:hypothetical protein [Maritimibacter harenae]MZR14241.1 hypothetical protein [Maritimibacter harenae]